MKRSSPPQRVSRLRAIRALPLLAAGAAALLVARADPSTAAWLFIAASLLFALVLATLLLRRVELAGVVMLVGALTWLGERCGSPADIATRPCACSAASLGWR